MHPLAEAPDITALLAEARAALAHLRVDELEALAMRAEVLLSSGAALRAPNSELRRQHGMLGDLLTATKDNLRVLRRTDARGESRWAR